MSNVGLRNKISTLLNALFGGNVVGNKAVWLRISHSGTIDIGSNTKHGDAIWLSGISYAGERIDGIYTILSSHLFSAASYALTVDRKPAVIEITKDDTRDDAYVLIVNQTSHFPIVNASDRAIHTVGVWDGIARLLGRTGNKLSLNEKLYCQCFSNIGVSIGCTDGEVITANLSNRELLLQAITASSTIQKISTRFNCTISPWIASRLVVPNSNGYVDVYLGDHEYLIFIHRLSTYCHGINREVIQNDAN